MLKKFVCLARSTREGGICVAGKEIFPGGRIGNWFRPVGRAKEALASQDCMFCIGHVVICEVSDHVPTLTQPENYKIAPHPNWQAVEKFPKQRIEYLLDSPPSLWSTGLDCSSRHGTNDKVPEIGVSSAIGSLYFIKVADAIIKKQDESYEKLREKIRLEFSYNSIHYSLIVTYPGLSDYWWRTLSVGQSEKIGSCYLTVSLAQPYNGYCYKLVAGYVPI